MSEEAEKILVIRRGPPRDADEHHGGVWKIAFADFMTAMMAFFLVMWLVSANDKMRAAIARSFNPVQVVDPTLQPRGLQDVKKDAPSIAVPAEKRGDKRASSGAKSDRGKQDGVGDIRGGDVTPARVKRLDAAMRDDPMAALTEIAAGTDTGARESTNARTLVVGRKGGTSLRDPFAPPPPPPRAAPDEDEAIIAATAPQRAQQAAPSERAPEPTKGPAQHNSHEEIGGELSGIGGKDKLGPNVTVDRTSEGLLISLTDTESFSMFANGSAVPAKRLITTMERIAKVLAVHKGDVVLRGFTDSKPFRSGRYDNWSLSIDRAQAAHYMLIRAGLAETRIAAVKGYADHVGRKGIDPSSPMNRRIEILLWPGPQ